ncbi:ParB/RepB/Spo0J family partition protein [Tautonia sp. JC769]|uniref:ParB/RepB/Spo0J family partition protein n=1 Tax=Tautonia sp. JC769 TaxID=3232135 RepID=UPI00345AFFF3
MQHHLIQINLLDKSPDNARRTVTKGASASLKASILAHGLMQNLVVTEGESGRYCVIEGARRLEALLSLQAEGKLPEDHAVPCQVVGTEQALEKSLAANTVRLAMHPADEFESFAKLIDEGATPSEIAERFGVESRHVLQRLKLGKVAPKLLSAYRAEQLTLDCLMAYTITDDHSRQLAVFHSLQGWQQNDPRAIRSAITGVMMEAGHKLARFVGLDTYKQAGGMLRSDLFSEEIFLEHPELLQALADEKLFLEGERVKAEGWGWVEVSEERDWRFLNEYTRIHPAPAEAPQELLDRQEALENQCEGLRMDYEENPSDTLFAAMEAADAALSTLHDEIESLATYDPEAMKGAGCYVTIGYDGSLSIERGLMPRETMRASASNGAEPVAETRKAMPDTLRLDLESWRLQISQGELARNPEIAFDLLAFTLACDEFGIPARRGPDIRLTSHQPTRYVREERTTASGILEDVRLSLPLEWLSGESEAERFEAFCELPQESKLALLAWCVAHSLQPQLSTGRESSAVERALSRTNGDVAACWRPDQQNFLTRITKDQLLMLGRELLGDAWAMARAKDKKGELAAKLERAFAEPEAPDRTTEQAERLKRWLPEGMAFLTAGSGGSGDQAAEAA